jgi:hypothetical protein
MKVQIILRAHGKTLYIFFTVVKELKGLARGGLRTRHRKKYANDLDGEEATELKEVALVTSKKAKLAMDFINASIQRFQIVTTTGRVMKVRSLREKIDDEFFNPKETNDDRIMKTVKCIEVNDKALRRLDNPRRIFRNTVLVTGDRCLRIRSFAEDLPGREIESIVFWASRFGVAVDANAKPGQCYRKQHRKRDRRGGGGGKRRNY